MKQLNYDVQGMSIGRAASEVAKMLMGKDDLDFARNRVPDVQIHILNCEKLALDPKGQIKKIYYRHSGYLGNLKSRSQKEIFENSPKALFMSVLGGMLPNNKLKTYRIKKVIFD